MAKTINFNHEGQHYVLEFSRRTVRQMENNGFTLNDLSDKPMNTLNELFAGAFKKNHRNVKPEQIDKMQALFADKDKLIETLFSMYSETIETLTTNDPAEDRENLITWSVGE